MNPDNIQPPSFKYFASLNVEVGTPQEVGNVGGGVRRLIPILGGSVSGIGWAGRVLPGGADYQWVIESRRAQLVARYVLETDGGDLIYVVNRGIRSGPPDALAHLQRGEPVAPDTVYSLGSPAFETASPSLGWIADRIFIAKGRRLPDRVEMQIFEIG